MMGVHNIVLAMLFSLISLVGIVGNTFVIAAVCLSTKLRTATNAFVVCLAVSDIINCITLIVQVVALAGIRSDTFLIVCTIIGPLSISLLGSSSFFLTLIAFCRFVLITKSPQTFRRIFNKHTIGVMIVCSYVIPVALVVPFLLFDLASAGLNNDTICTFYDSPIFNNTCGGIMLLLLVIVAFFYAKIFVFLRRHFRQLRSQSPTGVRQTSTVSTNPQNVETRGSPPPTPSLSPKTQNMELETKITKNMVLVLLVFTLCFLPLAIILIVSESAILGAYFFAIFSASSCLNPLLFGWKHPVFRQVFRSMFRRKLEDIEEPATWLRKIQQK